MTGGEATLRYLWARRREELEDLEFLKCGECD